jgi:hypothetical protein
MEIRALLPRPIGGKFNHRDDRRDSKRAGQAVRAVVIVTIVIAAWIGPTS